jgi:hypothetical protein
MTEQGAGGPALFLPIDSPHLLPQVGLFFVSSRPRWTACDRGAGASVAATSPAGCAAGHVAEQYGWAGSDKLSCPSEGSRPGQAARWGRGFKG